MSHLGVVPALIVSALIIALSAFFVAVEFALVAARRWRLEEAAVTSLSGRAALRSARELSLLLAGSQLGITLCLVALGAITKPTVHHLLTPLIELTGAGDIVADVAGFLLALVVVTFLHLVIGEMAPKSWAISHPEKSAILLAVPMRAFMWATRPMLIGLNNAANWCLRRIGVEPVDELATGHGPDELGELIEHSARVGALDQQRRGQLAAALAAQTRPVSEIVTPADQITAVHADASAATIRQTARDSGHLRLLVHRDNQPVGVVHVRDTLTRPDATATDLMTSPVPRIPAATPIYQALELMRTSHSPLAMIDTTDGRFDGILTMRDLTDELLNGRRRADDRVT